MSSLKCEVGIYDPLPVEETGVADVTKLGADVFFFAAVVVASDVDLGAGWFVDRLQSEELTLFEITDGFHVIILLRFQ